MLLRPTAICTLLSVLVCLTLSVRAENIVDNGGTVSGGESNQATGIPFSTVGGGNGNRSGGPYSTIGGGVGNRAVRQASTVSGGDGNQATDRYTTIAGGYGNQANARYATVSGGNGNTAGGRFSTVAGGQENTAGGYYSYAAGYSASDGGHDRTFVWDDGYGQDAPAPRTFNVNASNGIYFNGSLHMSSDRNHKEAFSSVNAIEVLDKVIDIPITTWRFKSEEDTVRHIGPVAQDFMATFGYGVDPRHITSTDADGVALTAIQGLNQKLEEKQTAITKLNQGLKQKQTEIDSLNKRLSSLERRILAMETITE